MAQDIVDIDALIPEEIPVKFKGEIYYCPGDMPMTVFLRLQQAGKRERDGAGEDELMGLLETSLLEVLGAQLDGQPEKIDKLREDLNTLGVRTYMKLLQTIYSAAAIEDAMDEEEDDELVPPTTPATASPDGTPSTPPTSTLQAVSDS